MNPLNSHEFESHGNVAFEQLLHELDIQPDKLQRMAIIEKSLANFPAKTVDDLIQIYKKTNVDDLQKLILINNFIQNENVMPINCDDFIILMNEANFEKKGHKHLLFQSFLQSIKFDKIDCDDFIKIINGIAITDDGYKLLLFDDFINSDKSGAITNDDFIKIVNEIHMSLDEYKVVLFNHYIDHEKSSDLNLHEFSNIIKGVGLQFRPDISIDLFNEKFLESENYVENFIDFIKELFQSEMVQYEFLKKFIKENEVYPDDLKHLKSFIEGLHNNQLALDLIENLLANNILVNETDTLGLIKNRSKKQYDFLTEIVKERDLNDCITQEGIATLKATFGEDLKFKEESITITDLISYYDVKDQILFLSTILKPEFKRQLRDNFAPSPEIFLYKPQELEKFKNLLSEEGIEFDVKSYFVENETLCDYLKEKVGDIQEIIPEKTYQINFANFVIDEDKQVEINSLFNKLLKSSDPNKEEVAKFFEDLLGITLSEFDEIKKDKLTTFFQYNKKELAYFFCNENFPKENFTYLFTSFYDGCHANIGTQFKKMLYASMIEDEYAQILYAVVDNKIFLIIMETT